MTNTHPDLKPSDRVAETCGRCGGTGLYSGPTLATWENGSGAGARPYCFHCGGAGTRSVLVSSIRARVRRDEKAAEARAEASRAFAARAAAYWAANAAIRDEATAAHIALREGDPLRRELGYALDAMETALDVDAPAEARRVLEALEARAAAARPVPAGRVEVVGILAATKLVDSAYGSTMKALVEGDGWKVWGTLPRGLDATKGDRVAFTATVTPSDDDPAFGFYARPTKARLV